MLQALTHEQVQFIKDWVKDPTIVAAAWWLIKRAFNKAVRWFSEEVTADIKEYVNLKIKEQNKYIDNRFADHEFNAFSRLNTLARKVTGDKDLKIHGPEIEYAEEQEHENRRGSNKS